MALKSCPSCGSTLEYEKVPAELESAHCATCDRQFTLVTPGSGPATIVSESDSEEETPAGAVGLSCTECGEPMELEISGGDRIQAVCTSCEHTAEFVLRGTEPPARPEFRPQARGRPERGGMVRPCRKCGGPLSFSQDEDGNTVGECGSCGNRFTMPPRTDSGGRGGPPRGRSFRGGDGGRRGYSGGDRGGSWRPSRGRFGRDRDSDDDDRPRRRRPPR